MRSTRAPHYDGSGAVHPSWVDYIDHSTPQGEEDVRQPGEDDFHQQSEQLDVDFAIRIQAEADSKATSTVTPDPNNLPIPSSSRHWGLPVAGSKTLHDTSQREHSKYWEPEERPSSPAQCNCMLPPDPRDLPLPHWARKSSASSQGYQEPRITRNGTPHLEFVDATACGGGSMSDHVGDDEQGGDADANKDPPEAALETGPSLQLVEAVMKLDEITRNLDKSMRNMDETMRKWDKAMIRLHELVDETAQANAQNEHQQVCEHDEISLRVPHF